MGVSLSAVPVAKFYILYFMAKNASYTIKKLICAKIMKTDQRFAERSIYSEKLLQDNVAIIYAN